MPLPPISKIKVLSNEIHDLINLLAGVEESDKESYAICQSFVQSNFLYHKHLDVLPKDVWSLADRIHQKFVIQSQLRKASVFSTFIRQLKRNVSELSKQKLRKKEEGVVATLYVLLKFAQPSVHTDVPATAYRLLSLLQSLETEQKVSRCLNESPENSSQLSVDLELYLSSSSNESSEDDSFSTAHSKVDSGFSVSPDPEVELLSPKDDDDDEVLPSDELTLVASQDPSDWLDQFIVKPYWNSERYWTPGPVPYITERILCNEIIWMLQGMTKLGLFKYSGGQFTLKHNFQLSHVTHTALISKCDVFCTHGSIVVRLQDFCSEVLKGHFPHICYTFRAFATSLQNVLADILARLVKAEKKLIEQKTAVTLLTLQHDLGAMFSELVILDNLYSSFAPKACGDMTSIREMVLSLLSCLTRTLTEASVYSNRSRELNILVTLLVETYKPYLKFTEDLLVSGKLYDPYREFVIERNLDCSSKSEKFWDLSLSCHGEEWPEYFLLQKILTQITTGGQSAEMLSKLKSKLNHRHKETIFTRFKNSLLERLSIEDHVVDKTKELARLAKERDNLEKWYSFIDHPNPLLVANFAQFLPLDKRKETPKESLSLKIMDQKIKIEQPFHNVLEQALHPLILDQCQLNNTKAIEVVINTFQIEKHLQIVRSLFLLEAGEVMLYFCSRVFDLFLSGRIWKDQVLLNELLQDSVNALLDSQSSQFKALFSIGLNLDLSHINKHSHNVLHLEALELHYEVPWPINIVLNSDSMKLYQQLFTFLLQLKLAKHSLDQLKVADFKEHPESRKAHVLCLLRMKFLCFVDTIHSYFMIRILHSTHLKLKSDMSAAANFYDLISTHKNYLDDLVTNSFQKPQLKIFRDTIISALNLMLRLALVWRQGIESISIDTLKDMDKQFSHLVNFLRASLDTVLRRGVFPHAEMLRNILFLMNQDCFAS